MKKQKFVQGFATLGMLVGLVVPSATGLAETVSTDNSEVTTTQQTVEHQATETTKKTTEPSNQKTSQTQSSQSSAGSTESSRATTETTTATSSQATDPATGTTEAKKADESNKTVPIQMLGINDFHGALSTTGSFYGLGGAKVSNAGTAALLASYFTKAQADFINKHANGKTLRVQSGDMVGASPANSGLLQDQPTMRILNQMKFDVGTLGNHEFDEGLAEYNRILLGNKPDAADNFYPIVYDYNKDYQQNQLAGGFDLVIANVKEKSTGKIPFGWQPYVIENLGTEAEPVKVGIIGVVTTEIPNLVLAEHHQDYEFTDPATEIATYSRALRDQGVNAIVVLGHTPSEQGAEESVSGETAEIIEKVNTIDGANSVDAYFAGHNHVYTDGVVNGTRVVQSTSQGKGYIDLQGEYDLAKQDFVQTPEATVNAVDPKGGLTPDAAIQGIVDDASARVKTVTEEKIGTAAEAKDITREVNEFGESAVGNLITDGQVYMAKKNKIPVDFAMTNNGGIRADLKVNPDGTITWGAAQAVQPFGNIMQIVEMTGQQIETVLNQQTFPGNEAGKNYFLQVSGLKYVVTDNPDAEAAKVYPQIVQKLTKADGTQIDPNATYRVVINDFLLGGGDGFTEFTKAKLVNAMAPDTETFIGYIKELAAAGQKITAVVEGRKINKTTEVNNEIAKTAFNDFHEGDKKLTGTTIPSGNITVTMPDGKQISATATQDSGTFAIDLTPFKVKRDQELKIKITGDYNGQGDFTVKVLQNRQEMAAEETAKIKAETKFQDYHEGEDELAGKTIPGATITLNAPSGAIAQGKANDQGEFGLDVSKMELKKDQKLKVVINGSKGGEAKYIRKVLPSHAELAADETKKIKIAEDFKDYHEGDQYLTGSTISNATITVLSPAGVSATDTADSDGKFKIDVSKLDLKKDQKMTVTIKGSQGGEAQFELTVLPKVDSTVTGGGSNGSGSTNTGGSTGSGSKPTSGSGVTSTSHKRLLQTNDTTQPILIILGVIIVTASGTVLYRRKKAE